MSSVLAAPPAAALPDTDWLAGLNPRQREAATYARQVSALRALAHLSPKTLEDFDAIQKFEGPSSAVDFELLAALQ